MTREATHGRRARANGKIAAAAALAALVPAPAFSAGGDVELDVPYVETPEPIIGIMLDMADVGRGDYVIDLGTGDGRLVIAAVKAGATGLGVDLDPQRVQEARANAEKAGVSARVAFLEQDLFETDVSNASVVLLYLNSEVNLRLRPILLERLAPGTRVVSHNFDMGDWLPDAHRQYLREAEGSFYMHDVYAWVVPADVAGAWSGTAGGAPFRMELEQEYQRIRPAVSIGGRPLTVAGATLYGRRLNVVAGDPGRGAEYLLNGTVHGDRIEGTVHVRKGEEVGAAAWAASRGGDSAR